MMQVGDIYEATIHFEMIRLRAFSNWLVITSIESLGFCKLAQ